LREESAPFSTVIMSFFFFIEFSVPARGHPPKKPRAHGHLRTLAQHAPSSLSRELLEHWRLHHVQSPTWRSSTRRRANTRRPVQQTPGAVGTIIRPTHTQHTAEKKHARSRAHTHSGTYQGGRVHHNLPPARRLAR
jgi:hypothetical protein